MTLTEQKKQALDLYINQSFTQQQVADAVGVCVRTIHNWVKQHAWDRLRLATHQAPALIADNFSSQLVELQNNIAAREPGKRFPTAQEMEIMRKLTVCINNTKKTVSLPQVTQMMRMFRSYVFDTRKKEFASIVADVIDSFIEARSRFGYAPYELEFGVEKIQPLDPLYNPYHEPIIKTETKPKEPEMPTTESNSTDSNVHTNSEGKKIYTINTDLWDDNIRNTLMAHFGDFGNTENMPPEEQAIHASIAEKLKPVFENKKPLTVNDLSAKTPETTGNKPAKPESPLQPLTPQNQPQATTAAFVGRSPLPENEKPLNINDLHTQTLETTGNEPENLETMLEGLRKAFLQYHPLQSDNVLDPNTTSNTATLPENETPLIINDLDTKTLENTGNKPAKPQTQKNTTSTPSLPLSDSLSPLQPNDNLIRQGEVFSRPVYITPTWPFREEPRGNKYKY
jgi:transposase-like protein